MKKFTHTIRDSFIWLCSISGATSLYCTKQRRRGPLVRVLCFHDVPDSAWFERVISELTKQYCILTPRSFHSHKFNHNKINLLLTFDDGYQSWIDVVLPIFAKYNIKGLFFITSGLLDAAEAGRAAEFIKKNLRLKKTRLALTWDGAKILVAAGHTIGGHTMTHPDLSKLTAEEKEWEIKENKNALETRLGTKIIDFAHPFGRKEHYAPDIVTRAHRAGYAYIYNAETEFFSEEQSYDIPRTLIERTQALASIHRWILGGNDIFTRFKSLFRTN